MDKNNSSSTSVCKKIRQALASNPAIRAVQRISSFNQEPKPVTKNPPSSITNITIQSKPPPHHKAHTQGSGSGSGAIPMMFDHHSAISSAAKGGASERATKVAAKGEPHPQHVPMQGKKQGHGVHSEPHGKKPMDINDHFKEFIQHTREKMMRSGTNIGWAQSNPAAATPDHHEAHGTNKSETHFSEFIQRARKKLRTTTAVRKNSNYLKKE